MFKKSLIILTILISMQSYAGNDIEKNIEIQQEINFSFEEKINELNSALEHAQSELNSFLTEDKIISIKEKNSLQRRKIIKEKKNQINDIENEIKKLKENLIIFLKNPKNYNQLNNYDEVNNDPYSIINIDYLHNLDMNGEGIQIGVIENSFALHPDIKYKKGFELKGKTYESAYLDVFKNLNELIKSIETIKAELNNKKENNLNQIEKLQKQDNAHSLEKFQSQAKIKEIENKNLEIDKLIEEYTCNINKINLDKEKEYEKYKENKTHGAHVSGIISKIAPGIIIVPFFPTDFVQKKESNNYIETIKWNFFGEDKNKESDLFSGFEDLKNKISLFNGKVITESLSRSLDNIEKEIFQKFINGKAYFYAAGNESCFLTETSQQIYKNNPSVHTIINDMIIIGNYDQEQNIIAESSNLPGSIYSNNFLYAPGANISSCSLSDDAQSINEAKTGTSMATPAAAAICSLLIKYFPDYDIQDIKSILLESAKPISLINAPSIFGKGLIDAENSVKCLSNKIQIIEDNNDIEEFINKHFNYLPLDEIEFIAARCVKHNFQDKLMQRIWLINEIYTLSFFIEKDVHQELKNNCGYDPLIIKNENNNELISLIVSVLEKKYEKEPFSNEFSEIIYQLIS